MSGKTTQVKKEFYFKIYNRGNEIVLAVCDKDILGKKVEENEIVLYAKPEFYKGEEIGEEKVAKFPSPKEALQFGLGRGLGASGRELSKFYMDLAKQTLPVIEVGAGKRVTIVFTEGTNLKIQKTCIKGRDGCIELKRSDGLSVLTTYYKN